MKTSVELKKEKVELAKKLTGPVTLKDLLDKALDALIAQNRKRNMIDLLGTDFFEGDLDKMRKRSN